MGDEQKSAADTHHRSKRTEEGTSGAGFSRVKEASGDEIVALLVWWYPAGDIGGPELRRTGADNFILAWSVIGRTDGRRIQTRVPSRGLGNVRDTSSFTPAAVNQLPDQIRGVIVGSYNDALTPVFTMLIPMLIAGFILAVFIKESPLRATLETPENNEAGRRQLAAVVAGPESSGWDGISRP